MYRQHFGLTRFPFEEPEHPDQLFASRAIQETDTRLQHLLQLRGIGLLTGEAGSGKTSACRRFTSSLNPGHHRVFYVSLTTGSVLDCCQILAWELGLQVSRYRSLAYRAIRAEIRRLSEELRTLPLLVVDEAHHLSREVLEDLRLMMNFDMESQRHLCLLLVGLTPLRQTLNLQVNESLRQRIVVSHSLSGLRRDELEPYLRQRLRQAGCETDLFQPQACEALYLAGRGLPREINRIAHFALVAAALEKARQVSSQHVQSGCSEAQP